MRKRERRKGYTLALEYLRAKRRSKKREHKYWIIPRLQGRNDHGAYKHIQFVKELKLDDISFQKHFRWTTEQFRQVL